MQIEQLFHHLRILVPKVLNIYMNTSYSFPLMKYFFIYYKKNFHIIYYMKLLHLQSYRAIVRVETFSLAQGLSISKFHFQDHFIPFIYSFYKQFFTVMILQLQFYMVYGNIRLIQEVFLRFFCLCAVHNTCASLRLHGYHFTAFCRPKHKLDKHVF